MRVDLYGKPKVGKSHFAMTAPEPIAYFVFDTGIELVLAKFAERDIDLFTYPTDTVVTTVKGFPMPQDNLAIDKVYGKFIKDYFEVVAKGSRYSTLVIDTGTRLWEIVYTSYQQYLESQGKDTSKMGALLYGKPNSVMYSIVDTAYANGKNLILVNHAKEEWIDKQATGRWLADEWKQTAGLVDVQVRMDKYGEKQNIKHRLTITACRHSDKLEGEYIDGADWETLEAVVTAETPEVPDAKVKKRKK